MLHFSLTSSGAFDRRRIVVSAEVFLRGLPLLTCPSNELNTELESDVTYDA